ncbi:hypothetical protein KDA14_04280 [Candidatus Saccharibacteria bacterium]|nr:hypothetical protein [Candidatus Saccharibacteria bacterium]
MMEVLKFRKLALISTLISTCGCNAITPAPGPNRAVVLEQLDQQIRERQKVLGLPDDTVLQCGVAPIWYLDAANDPTGGCLTDACAKHDKAYEDNETLHQGEDARRAADSQLCHDVAQCPVWHVWRVLICVVPGLVGPLWWYF